MDPSLSWLFYGTLKQGLFILTPLKIHLQVRPGVASGFMDGSHTASQTLSDGHQTFGRRGKTSDLPTGVLAEQLQTSRCLGREGKEQHFINNILPLTKTMDKCMNNPKEQIKWETLMVASVHDGRFYSGHFALL